jgi:hypothetical protein
MDTTVNSTVTCYIYTLTLGVRQYYLSDLLAATCCGQVAWLASVSALHARRSLYICTCVRNIQCRVYKQSPHCVN